MEHLKSDLSKSAEKDPVMSELQTILFVMSLVFPFLATIALAPGFREKRKKFKIKRFKLRIRSSLRIVILLERKRDILTL